MNTIKKIYQYAEPNLSSVGWMGFIGFPVYYYIWTYLFPQPYESLWLRATGAILCLGLALRSFVPIKIKKYLPYYYYFTMGFCLPFFFSYMMIMNSYNNVWVMSFTASICLHILLIHETKSLIMQTTISIAIAYFTADYMIGNELKYFIDWMYVPIFLFVYFFGNVFYFRNQVSHETKVSIAKSFGAGIAHEMRNPLSAIKSSLEIIQSVFNESHPSQSVPAYTIEQHNVQMVNDMICDMHNIVDSANETINLLLTSIDQNRIPTSTFKMYSVDEITRHAIHSFSYKNPVDRLAVTVTTNNDFRFLGSDILLKYAFYNLLKNAFYYQNNENFRIDISIRSQKKCNQITVRDNGSGIDPQHLQDIFKDFYTHGKHGGYGLGLPFCRRIMEAVGGKIECSSVLGEWTEFTLSFPKEFSPEMKKLKEELIHSKSLLYIGNESAVCHRLKKQAQQMGFSIETVTLPEAIERNEYEFEFDMVMIDLDQIDQRWDYLTVLESLLHFSEARLHYLYNSKNHYPINIERYLSVYPLEVSQIIQDSTVTLYQLFFELDEKIEADKNVIPLRRERVEKYILIVDDNHSVRNLTAMLLEKQGYHVLQASNGQEALGTIETHTVDLILMDIEMPVLDGIETTSTIRSSQKPYRHIPILGHTGDSNTPTLKRIQDSGMNDYIIKPADTENLLGKLANWI
ncbi:hybrid sensor histidine kinase/response regulator [Vibrio mangrovi]|uniref:histidine kinase n=1 Tax=Vibrio mangrovi TaxID=474394 RepID=A0A1Y6ITV4_9VIBR|nr:hybrid sensor histidine kinase/response regulator [Vibrio mangrovi]MDW6004777.1 response regulator [Vibrio mangrovi]SMS01068.1 CAI-1 autoinducer sensor kinase/phosphatase CqsS [Vibrio mangrovi]